MTPGELQGVPNPCFGRMSQGSGVSNQEKSGIISPFPGLDYRPVAGSEP